MNNLSKEETGGQTRRRLGGQGPCEAGTGDFIENVYKIATKKTSLYELPELKTK